MATSEASPISRALARANDIELEIEIESAP
jgi:hypothetical protein